MVEKQTMFMPADSTWKQRMNRLIVTRNLLRTIQRSTIFRMLNLQTDNVVLDCGCGNAYYLNNLTKSGAEVIAADWEVSKGILIAHQRNHKVPFVRADAQRLPFADEQFDAVLLSSVLQMVKNEKALLSECQRILKNQGVLVLSVTVDYRFINKLNSAKPQLKGMFEVAGRGYFSLDEVKRLLENNFRVLEVEYSPHLLGSCIYEVELYLWYRFRIPFLSAAIFPIFGVVAFLDKHLGGIVGDELIIKAQKR